MKDVKNSNEVAINGSQSEIMVLDKIKKVNNKELFTPAGMDALIKEVQEAARSFVADITTEDGQAAITSMAYKVSCSKTPLVDIANSLKSGHQEAIQLINKEVGKFTESFNKLRDEIKAPVLEIKAKQDAFKKERRERIAKIDAFKSVSYDSRDGDVLYKRAFAIIRELIVFDWQIFATRADDAFKDAESNLTTQLAKWKELESQRLELEQLRKKEAERQKKDHEDRIARDAADRAKREAEELALRLARETTAMLVQQKQDAKDELERIEKQKEALEQEKVDAEKRVAESERLRKEQEEQAKIKMVENEKKAQLDAQIAAKEAVEKERKRAEEEKRKELEETAKREADKKHHSKIHNEILAALIKESKDPKDVVRAIARGKIPHVSINY